MEDVKVAEPVRVSNVVDADPDEEERGVGFPAEVDWCCWFGEEGDEEVVDLVLEREDFGLPRGDEVGVDGGSAVGEVVDGLACAVVLGCEVADPVGAVGGVPSGVGRVAEGVGFGGEGGSVGHVEAGGGVGVTAGWC